MGRERLFVTGRRGEGDILKVLKMAYFHINQYQGRDKNLICVVSKSDESAHKESYNANVH